jgi:hypothetical protein
MERFRFMAQLNEHPPLPKMKVCTPDQQFIRQRISDNWQPNGFDRYRYQKGLLDAMNRLGSPCDLYGCNPDRYKSVGSLEEDFPIKK